jgi:tetratricopeptide (TPR) repeat protein
MKAWQNPQKAEYYYNKGVLFMPFDCNKEAIAEFNIAIEMNPRFAEAYYSRGMVKSRLGDSGGAIADYDMAIDIDPTETEQYYPFCKRGKEKAKLQRYSEAISDFSKAIEINPHNGTAYKYRGMAKEKLGQGDTGRMDFIQAGALGFEID